MGSTVASDTETHGATASAKKYASGDPEKMSASLRENKLFHPPTFTSLEEEQKFRKHRLAIAYRILAAHGLHDTVAGHITVRDPIEPDSFWVNPFGMDFSLITDEDLIRVNHAGEVVEGGRNRLLNYAAYAIHAQIHNARPDVICAVHSHTIYGRAFSATGGNHSDTTPRTLSMLSQDFCAFYNDHVFYPNFGGVVLAEEEGRQIASALGPCKAAILANHGLLTVGQTVEAAVGYFVSLEKLCQSQLIAEAAVAGTGGQLSVIGREEAENVYRVVGTPQAGYFMGLTLFQVGEREFGERTLLGKGVEAI